MLQLKYIKKVYKTKFTEQVALKGIELSFEKGEFVSILGPSGCGKTTLLNIIGGLDRYTSGDLVINGKSTKEFNAKDWDAYRNNSIGFVFQNYNLIHHISILENVEMGMTLSGITKEVRREKARGVLTRVGLEEHLNKNPYQLSGGQKQRVAIARALANDPDVILADEPTGALDTETSEEVLSLIQEIAEEKLVIMVTHNQEIANEYSSRIVRLLDGEVVDDSRPTEPLEQEDTYDPNRTAMSFFTALNLSFNNLRTKKWRTLITAFAGSIGIIGIALVLSISNGFNESIDALEKDTFSGFPLMVNKYKMETGVRVQFGPDKRDDSLEDVLVPYDSQARNRHENKINEDYIAYINELDDSLYTSLEFSYGVSEHLLTKSLDTVNVVNPRSIGWSTLFDDDEFTTSQYDILEGRLPENKEEIVVVIDLKNQIDKRVLSAFGFELNDEIAFDKILGKELVVGSNNSIYTELDGRFNIVTNQEDLTNAYEGGLKLTVVGLLRGKEDGLQSNSRGVYYKSELTESIITDAKDSNVCSVQTNADYNVLTGIPFNTSAQSKDDVLHYLGCISTPSSINIYPTGTEEKSEIKAYLDDYNTGKIKDDQILYEDLSKTITDMMGQMVSMISSVLVSFAAISLVVSSIMIGIITYVSVLERTKEIGILRALGARKKDISRVFNAETIIVGLTAGVLGIFITYLLSFPINRVLSNMTEGLENVVKMTLRHSVLLIITSMLLTFIAGLIPSRIAAKKHPVEALRHNE
ncbi:ABC transporter ATP-binding protein/permease [Haloplasma contractile]|uniref:Macrolide transport system ATP-binding-permease protein n=1 Tax=Haloplasma contractile SSD-17B TaxID=1033810 RepID=F7PVH8_9MOLU|nr:ABC transporter ATP-binding protein/permease [Haloplasma contractile]ERJ12854.1 macrolide transport system ATP-binding-permease protein [Haloplasma contractile SSD-17B]